MALWREMLSTEEENPKMEQTPLYEARITDMGNPGKYFRTIGKYSRELKGLEKCLPGIPVYSLSMVLDEKKSEEHTINLLQSGYSLESLFNVFGKLKEVSEDNWIKFTEDNGYKSNNELHGNVSEYESFRRNNIFGKKDFVEVYCQLFEHVPKLEFKTDLSQFVTERGSVVPEIKIKNPYGGKVIHFGLSQFRLYEAENDR